MTDQIRFFLSKRTCAQLDLKGNEKYHAFPIFKATSPLSLSV